MCKHELERDCIDMSFMTRKENERSEIFIKCHSLLIIDVARLTPITKTVQTQLHKHPRTLEICALIPSLSLPDPTT